MIQPIGLPSRRRAITKPTPAKASTMTMPTAMLPADSWWTRADSATLAADSASTTAAAAGANQEGHAAPRVRGTRSLGTPAIMPVTLRPDRSGNVTAGRALGLARDGHQQDPLGRQRGARRHLLVAV